MKKYFVKAITFLVLTLMLASAAGATALSAGEDWVYPENALAFMLRLGMACKVAGIEAPYDPEVWEQDGSGGFAASVGGLAVGALYDLHTQKIQVLMFTLDNERADQQYLIMAAFTVEAPIISNSAVTKDHLLNFGKTAIGVVIAEILEAQGAFVAGAYSFEASMTDNDALRITIRAVQ